MTIFLIALNAVAVLIFAGLVAHMVRARRELKKKAARKATYDMAVQANIMRLEALPNLGGWESLPGHLKDARGGQ